MAIRSQRATFITRLALKDVKSFAGEQVLDLTDKNGSPARWTLLLGDNGVGKTTLLEAITQLTPVFNSDVGEGEEDAPLHLQPRFSWAENDDIFSYGRNGVSACRAEATFSSDALLDRGEGAEVLTTWVEFTRDGGKWSGLVFSRYPEAPEDAIPESTWSEESSIFPPLILTYGAGRYMGEGNFDLDATPESTDSLLVRESELFDAEELLLHLHHASLPTGAATARRQKKALVNMIADFLPEVKNSDGIDIKGATAIGEKTRQGVWVTTRDGAVPLKQLSFGYQTMTAWIGDIAMRLFAANPTSRNALHAPAIVVIDEIDLHLHPRWQRELRGLLTKNFPNVQFIATAHSPLIAQAFLDANLAVISRVGDHSVIENEPAAIANWRIDQIVTSELFDLPSPWPPDVDELFARHAKLASKSKPSPAERQELLRLEKQMLELPTEESPADETAMRIIRRSARRLIKD